MLDTIKDFFKSLNKKEKIIVISSMSALAVVLIAVVLLISFCGRAKHQHDYQYNIELKDGKFNVIGRCFGEEGECKKRDVFFADVKPNVSSSEDATCTKDGQIVYTYTQDGKELTYIATVPQLADHKLNGSLASELTNADGSLNYDIPGVRVFSGTSYVCNETVNGYYVCDDCTEAVNVKVYRTHEPIEIPGVTASCTTTGTLVTICKHDDCRASLGGTTTVPALGHSYSYKLNISSDSSANLSYKCQREGCTEGEKTETVASYTVTGSTTATCITPATTVYKVTTANGKTYENIVVEGNTVPHKLGGKDVESGSEHSYGVAGIKYFADSKIECGTTGKAYFECETCKDKVEVKVTKPAHSHQLDYSTLVAPTATDKGYIHYPCTNQDCSFFINIPLEKVIVSGEGQNATVVSAATETKGEVVRYKYTDPIFGVTVEIAEIISTPAIGHNYTYALEGNSVGVGATVKGTCSNAGCTKPEIEGEISQIVKSVITNATCKTPAGSMYEVILKTGEKLTLEISSGTTLGDHQLNGVDASTLANYDGSYYDNIQDIVIFGGAELQCDATANGYYRCEACDGIVSVTVKGAHSYSVQVDNVPTESATGTGTLSCSKCNTSSSITLDKLVLSGANKNAVKISETSVATVYDYAVYISIDDKVVVRITVPKTAA